MPPPLMSNFMRSNISPEIVRAAAHAEQLSSLSRINKRQVRHQYKSGPCLSKRSGGLLGHGNSGVRQLAKKCIVDPSCILSISQRQIAHLRSGDRAKSSARSHSLSFKLFYIVLNLLQLIRNFFIGIKLNVIAAFLVGDLFLLKLTVIEPRNL